MVCLILTDVGVKTLVMPSSSVSAANRLSYIGCTHEAHV
jgi:hypothetical protein